MGSGTTSRQSRSHEPARHRRRLLAGKTVAPSITRSDRKQPPNQLSSPPRAILLRGIYRQVVLPQGLRDQLTLIPPARPGRETSGPTPKQRLVPFPLTLAWRRQSAI